ncbi:MAG: lipoate--protein ligase [Firmicutes bacterium HGW-Firmicutes-3]|jgi:lipoate-protein ligase A|nr:MAG: lipoate--protein ligase [Firmicutes bacterium HGW-Firmicutes-3]
MRVILSDSTSAYYNLACEEYMATHYDEDMFMLWTSVPSILIGKHQNTYSEINVDYVEANKIPVVRRMSGGGTVFCDLGNMNFTFIESNPADYTDFEKFTKPILKYLRFLGVPAMFTGRNDMTIDGKKISGNAQYRIKNKVIHHGTLLFDSSLSDLTKALTPRNEKFQDKAIKSVASRVTNISNHLSHGPLTILEFKQGLYEFIGKNFEGFRYYPLSKEDQEGIIRLVETKYETWSWNFGKSPKYNYKHCQKFSGGLIEIGLNVNKGLIAEISIQGDFFGYEPIETIESLLVGVRHEKLALLEVLELIDLYPYMGQIRNEELVRVIMGDGL